jgi:hypothetical protein
MTLYIEGLEGDYRKQGFQVFDFSTEVNMKVTVFWDATSCTLVDMCQRFGETHCRHLQNRTEESGSCETSVDLQTTWRHVPDDSNLQIVQNLPEAKGIRSDRFKGRN